MFSKTQKFRKPNRKDEYVVLYPATRIIVAFCFILINFFLPLGYQAIFLISGGIISFILTKKLLDNDPGRMFFRLWLMAGFFLLIIHNVSFQTGFVFNQDTLMVTGRIFFRIGSIIITMLWLVRTIKAELLYMMLLNFRLPVPVIYVIFKTIHLIPRFGNKAKEILFAQQSRGFVLKGIKNRLKALCLILSPLFSSLIFELEENAASITARGLHAVGSKEHLAEVKFKIIDGILIIISLGFVLVIITIFQ